MSESISQLARERICDSTSLSRVEATLGITQGSRPGRRRRLPDHHCHAWDPRAAPPVRWPPSCWPAAECTWWCPNSALRRHRRWASACRRSSPLLRHLRLESLLVRDGPLPPVRRAPVPARLHGRLERGPGPLQGPARREWRKAGDDWRWGWRLVGCARWRGAGASCCAALLFANGASHDAVRSRLLVSWPAPWSPWQFPPWAYPLPFHDGPLPGEPKDARYLDVNGVRLRYTDQGCGPAVVLLHGFASALEIWNAIPSSLSRSHRVLTLDLKGFGWSARPPGDYSPQAQAALVLALMDRLGMASTSVVGHSWGASVALGVAISAPQRVRKLVLCSAWVYEEQLPPFFVSARMPFVGEWLFHTFYGLEIEQQMRLAFHDRRFITRELVADVERALTRPGTRAAALAAVRGMRLRSLQGSYRSLRQPTLLLWGEDDRICPVHFGERLAAEVPGSCLRWYPRCGHFPMLEWPDQTLADIQRFLLEAD